MRQSISSETGSTMSVVASTCCCASRATSRISGYALRCPASSIGVIGTPSAIHQEFAASHVIGTGEFVEPGIGLPARPKSTGGCAPNRSFTWLQKLVLPAEVLLIDPAASATASYVTVIPPGARTSALSRTSCAWNVLNGGRIENTPKSASMQCIPRLFHPTRRVPGPAEGGGEAACDRTAPRTVTVSAAANSEVRRMGHSFQGGEVPWRLVNPLHSRSDRHRRDASLSRAPWRPQSASSARGAVSAAMRFTARRSSLPVPSTGSLSTWTKASRRGR